MHGKFHVPATGEDAQKIVQPVFLAHPGDIRRLAAIVEQDRLDGNARRHRVERGEQRALERQQPGSVAGRPFGKDRQRARAQDRGADLLDLALDRSAVVPGDKHRAVRSAQPANERNRGQPVVADEGRARGRGNRGNVDPADMIGEQELTAGRPLPGGAQRYARNPGDAGEKPARPGIVAAAQVPGEIERGAQRQPAQHRGKPHDYANPAEQPCRPDRSRARHAQSWGAVSARSSLTP